jgi:CheY-like chemotaxis protein
MAARILLVDDDPNILETAKDILEDAGYEVAVASTMAEGLTALQGQTYQILLSDLNLPDGSGLKLAERAKELAPSLRIMLMTGQIDGAQPAGLQARQDGVVDDYLVKPVNPPTLLRALERLLG